MMREVDGPAGWPSGRVELSVPADPEFLATVRAVVRSTVALTTLAVEDVEELQIAVSEAATLLLPLIDPNGPQHLMVQADTRADGVRLRVSALCRPDAAPDREGLGWVMLSALDPGVKISSGDADVSITFSRSRTAPPA